MKKLIEQLGEFVESSGSVQTSIPLLTYKTDNGAIDYVVWAKVVPYWGSKPAPNAIYVHTRGRTADSDSLGQLLSRLKATYGGQGSLMRFQGPENEYPYTSKGYRGDTVDEIKKLRGYETVRIIDGKKADL